VPAANGANQQDGDICQNDFRLDLAGATDNAVWNYIKRDGVKVTHYMYYFIELVSGRLLQMTNADKSRTYAAIHQHAGRLYIHEATVPQACPSQSSSWSRWHGPTRRDSRFAIAASIPRVRGVDVPTRASALHAPGSHHVD
jgi:hypothetical protein